MKKMAYMIISMKSLAAFACPLGANDSQLNIHRIMLNYGKYSRTAESVCFSGKDYPLDVTDETLDKAIFDLDIVLNCAQIAIENPHEDMLPVKAKSLTGEEKEQYIKKYIEYTMEFETTTKNFQNLLLVEKQKEKPMRNYLNCYKYIDVFNSVINKGHREL